jgi:hypothetical protein
LEIEMRKAFYILCILSVVAIVACKKLYNPTVIATNPNYLVVEGVINNGADSTIIKLSRTTKLAAGTSPAVELKAVVTVEDDKNNTYTLKEIGNGNYAAVLTLNNAYNYRLRIKTTDGIVYLSDYVAVKNAPPIDSVGYKVTGPGTKIYLNTHDPSNNTRYYRWDYVETWRFHTEFESKYITNGVAIVPRTPSQSIYYCYTGDNSTSILLGTTTKLSQDVVYQTPVVSIDSLSEKTEVRYSILLKQYALTKEAYAFWSNIQKNTETLGSVFDALPSAPLGNIHCVTNPAQPVIGFISVGTVTTKRIFIDHSDLPNWGVLYPYTCMQYANQFLNPLTNINEVATYLIPLTSNQIIIDYLVPCFCGYASSTRTCADCTIRGKIAVPPFWK